MNGWVWSNGGMILTGENWSTGRKTLCSVGGRWMNEHGAMVEWYVRGKSEIFREKPIPLPLVQRKFYMDWPGHARTSKTGHKQLPKPPDISGHPCSSESCMQLTQHIFTFHTFHPRCNDLRCPTLRHVALPLHILCGEYWYCRKAERHVRCLQHSYQIIP